ncbi:MAG: hypothetical protein KIT34_10755 [Cyanobacteria bacterium TGS_CYA1]|nr:hypothetical protein [Cyanobacteria bacterium TGS_CYA1]
MKNWHKRLSINTCINSTLIALLLFVATGANQAAFSALSGDLPPESVKVMPMSDEESVSTYIQGEKGRIAVNVMYPSMTRYERGAPVAVVVPGNKRASGLSISSHITQVGFCEVRFAFPGGGLKDFHTDGSWDERGLESQKVLKEVLLYASSQKPDINGKMISDLIPKKVDTKNVGILSWYEGGNITLVTLSKFANDLQSIQPNLKWLAFSEPQVGALFYPSIMGTKKELIANPYYKHGSAATGRIWLDFSKLRYQDGIYRNSLVREKQKMTTPKGVLFFDDNQNGTWEEEIEFPIPYATLPNVHKQFYAPEVVSAIVRLKLFAPLPEPKVAEPPKETTPPKGKFMGLVKPPKEQPKKTEELKKAPEDRWPKTIARLHEVEEYFTERDGSLYIDSVVKNFPNTLIGIYASKVDLNEQQADHPNITYLYNLFLSAKPKWLRLNPDPTYAGFVADMNEGNFINNKPNSAIESDKIEVYLEPEGLVSDHLFTEALIAEMADRAAANNLKVPLGKVIRAYLNEARIRGTMSKNPQIKQDSTAKPPEQSAQGQLQTQTANKDKSSSKPKVAKELPRDSNLRDEEWDWPAEFDEK